MPCLYWLCKFRQFSITSDYIMSRNNMTICSLPEWSLSWVAKICLFPLSRKSWNPKGGEFGITNRIPKLVQYVRYTWSAFSFEDEGSQGGDIVIPWALWVSKIKFYKILVNRKVSNRTSNRTESQTCFKMVQIWPKSNSLKNELWWGHPPPPPPNS